LETKVEVINDIFYNVIKILVKNLLLPRSNWCYSTKYTQGTIYEI